MKGQAPSERYLVPGLVRGVEVLRLFNASRPSITPSEMASELGIPRSSLFRVLQTLEYLKLLVRHNGGAAYTLGVGLLGLGFDYIANLDAVDVGRPELEALRDRTGCSCHLVVRDGRDVVVVLRIPGRSAFSSNLTVGTRLPAHATVLGRSTLVDLDEPELRALYAGGKLPAFSKHTPTSFDALLETLRLERARGFGVSKGYFESGISAAAVPVRDHTGRAVAGINVTVTGDGGVDEPTIRQLRATADAISTALNYRPTPPVTADSA